MVLRVDYLAHFCDFSFLDPFDYSPSLFSTLFLLLYVLGSFLSCYEERDDVRRESEGGRHSLPVGNQRPCSSGKHTSFHFFPSSSSSRSALLSLSLISQTTKSA